MPQIKTRSWQLPQPILCDLEQALFSLTHKPSDFFAAEQTQMCRHVQTHRTGAKFRTQNRPTEWNSVRRAIILLKERVCVSES